MPFHQRNSNGNLTRDLEEGTGSQTNSGFYDESDSSSDKKKSDSKWGETTQKSVFKPFEMNLNSNNNDKKIRPIGLKNDKVLGRDESEGFRGDYETANEKNYSKCNSQTDKKEESENSKTAACCPEKGKDIMALSSLELNEYVIEDIKKYHEQMAKQKGKSTRSKLTFFREFSKNQKIVLACLCLVEFTSFCSMSIMAPFFPKEALEKGMSETTAGLVFSFYALVVFLSSPFLGKVLPQVGGKFLFLLGLFLTSSCNFIFGLLGYIKEEWVFTLLCFVVQGFKALGASAYSTATFVFVAEIFPLNIGAILGVMETFVGLGMSIGPAIGGFFYCVGGFGLPFYILGAILLLTFPLAFWLLPITHGNTVKKKHGSLLSILKEPSVIITGFVVVANSNIWSFLDPTLEPHLREFDLTPEKIGFIFLLFSALYGLSSPLWGIVSDKTGNHWSMMSGGLLSATIGLLILGPAPFVPFLENVLWLKLVALSLLGVSIALSILPTFQNLVSAIVSGGHGKTDITTFSIVSGIWSSLYALGEVIGPLAGGLIAQHYGFAFCCTVMAGVTFTLSFGSCLFFLSRDIIKRRGKKYRYTYQVDSDSDSEIDSDDMATIPILQYGYKT